MHNPLIRWIGAALLIIAALAWLLLPDAEVEMETETGAFGLPSAFAAAPARPGGQSAL